MNPRKPPPERQCQAMVAGLLNRGVYWAPPRRCGHYARANGYCGQHQPVDAAPGDAERPQAARDARGGDAG
jgi:hypothetical protein